MNATSSGTARAYPLEILEVVPETADAVSIVFARPTDTPASFDYHPGQFLTLRVPAIGPDNENGSVSRCYSLSSAPDLDDHLQVTVKRTKDGYASNWLCDHVRPGMILESLRPGGAFTLRAAPPRLLLFAAGSGITPIMSILRTALRTGPTDVTLVYANRTRESVIFREDLTALEAEYGARLTVRHWIEAEHGLPDAESLEMLCGPSPTNGEGAHAYLCGPGAFMDAAALAATAAGIPAGSTHREVFASLTADAFSDPTRPPRAPSPAADGEGTAGGDTTVAAVTVDGETHSVDWPSTEVLLDVLLARGIDAPYVCREGNCGGCAYTLREGEVAMLVNDTLDDHELRGGVRLACQSVPRSARVVAEFDR